MSTGNFRKWMIHAKNKHMDEGALRNVLYEIKDVIKPFNALIKQQGAAMAEVSKWGQAQKMVVCSFLGDMVKLEGELQSAENKYVEGYQEYVQEWSEILTERKELKALQDALRKANKKVEHAKSKLESAEKTADKQRDRANSKAIKRK